jgi:hypothetical protein
MQGLSLTIGGSGNPSSGRDRRSLTPFQVSLIVSLKPSRTFVGQPFEKQPNDDSYSGRPLRGSRRSCVARRRRRERARSLHRITVAVFFLKTDFGRSRAKARGRAFGQERGAARASPPFGLPSHNAKRFRTPTMPIADCSRLSQLSMIGRVTPAAGVPSVSRRRGRRPWLRGHGSAVRP